MASFDQWATPTSQKAASASLYDAGGFDDELPPPSSDQPQGSSYVKTALSSRGPVIETKNSHLLELTQPPTWQTDAEVPVCTKCAIPFDFFIRRHHCRLCGLIFCDEDTSQRAMLPMAWGEKDPQRVCGDCCLALQPIQEELAETNANSLRVNQIEDAGIWRYVNRPVNWSIGGDVRKAAYSIQNLIDGVESVIEDDHIKMKNFMEAEALLFITTAKVACGGGVRFGTGILVNKLPGTETGWSAPCAVGSLGIIFGLVIGAEVTDFIIPLKSVEALEHFKKSFAVTLGGDAGFAFGPVGRNAAGEASVSGAGVNATTTISNSKGLYGGITLDGSVVKVRHDINQKFYGREWTVQQLLDGTVPCPPAGKPLYDKLAEYKDVIARREAGGGGVVDDGGDGGAVAARLADPTGYTVSTSGYGAQSSGSGSSSSSSSSSGGGGSSMFSSFGAGSQSSSAAAGGGQQQAAAGAAFGAYQKATPEQRQATWSVAKGAYDSATPEQRSAAFGAVTSAVANAPDDVFV